VGRCTPRRANRIAEIWRTPANYSDVNCITLEGMIPELGKPLTSRREIRIKLKVAPFQVVVCTATSVLYSVKSHTMHFFGPSHRTNRPSNSRRSAFKLLSRLSSTEESPNEPITAIQVTLPTLQSGDFPNEPITAQRQNRKIDTGWLKICISLRMRGPLEALVVWLRMVLMRPGSLSPVQFIR
jgi:hypothetical protein